VKRARELIYTAERQASRDVSLAGLRLKPGSSHQGLLKKIKGLSGQKRGCLKLVIKKRYKKCCEKVYT
jgi:hypothetical protein